MAFTNTAGALFQAGANDVVIAGIGDFNGDGKTDVLHRRISTGQTSVWTMAGTIVQSATAIASTTTTLPGTTYAVSAIGDFNGDNIDDIVWRSSTQTLLWSGVAGNTGSFTATTLAGLGASGPIGGRADFNGDGTDDLILSEPNLDHIVFWNMQNSVVQPVGIASTDYIKTLENTFAKPGGAAWKVEAVGQFAR
jgi:peptidyl-Asp metalloendopeptidase